MQLTSNSMSLSGVTRSYLLFILLLLLGNLLYGYNTVNGYLSAKQNMLSSVARLLQQRIETYRFITYQLYETPPTTSPPTVRRRSMNCAYARISTYWIRRAIRPMP
ncbi:phosphotransfer intermediate protein in two-component regulatory system with RcsBC [Edwardsiella tarda]|nr:phosphotransfer intermediate protein in two-component regulatory system with RcsBC [Edwardsiella tarda]